MIAAYVPAKKTPCTPLELAQAYENELGGDGKVSAEFIAVLMAHGVLETGRDVARQLIATSCYNFNLGNVKASGTYEGKYTSIRLNEYLTENGVRALIWFSPEGRERGGSGGKLGEIIPPTYSAPPWHPQTRMRALEDLDEGVKSKIKFLMQPRFKVAWSAAQRGDHVGYVTAIHQQKYFTANLAPYIAGVSSLFRTYLPVSSHVSETPLVLSDSEELEIDQCIEMCSPTVLDRTTPEHVAAVQIDLTHEFWESQKRKPNV